MEKKQIRHIVGKLYAAHFAAWVGSFAFAIFILLMFFSEYSVKVILFWVSAPVTVGYFLFYFIGTRSLPAQRRYLYQRRDALREFAKFLRLKENLEHIKSSCLSAITYLSQNELSVNASDACLSTSTFNAVAVSNCIIKYRHDLAILLCQLETKQKEKKQFLKKFNLFSQEMWNLWGALWAEYEIGRTDALDNFRSEMDKLILELHTKYMQVVKVCDEEAEEITTLLQTQYVELYQ